NVLDPMYRIPVVLRYWYDLSYREIAEIMGVPESTVKTRLHRARLRLAEYMQSNLDRAVPEGKS
ncbi:MAG: RNA polymerase sigma factor, partial [Anaerolineae bacterium]|nr:RNA polymerase sigma factor [Anaerolineae bacterium]